MSSNQKSNRRANARSALTGKSGAGNGTKNASPRQKELDRLAGILKCHLGLKGFVSARENDSRVFFRLNGEIVGEAESTEVFCAEDRQEISIPDESGLWEPVRVSGMKRPEPTYGNEYIGKGFLKKCWVVMEPTAVPGEALYMPGGVVLVDGKCGLLRESAARKCIALWVASAMTGQLGRKAAGGKRVKVNVHSKDGKGPRYTFRFGGEDIAEWYHDGRFIDMKNGREFTHYIERAGISDGLCHEAERAKAEMLIALSDTSRDAGEVAGLRRPADKLDQFDGAYDDDAAYFEGIAERAVEIGSIPRGASLDDYTVPNKKTLTRAGDGRIIVPMVRIVRIDRKKITQGVEDYESDASVLVDLNQRAGAAKVPAAAATRAAAQRAVAPAAA